MEIKKFLRVFKRAYRHNSCYFDNKKRNYCESQSRVQVSIRASEKRSEFSVMENPDTSYAGRKFQHICCKDEKKYRQKQWEKFAGHFPALKNFRYVIINKAEKTL